MATEWKSQQADGMFYLQFETDNKEKYMLVEKAAQMAIDGKTTADYAEVKHGVWVQDKHWQYDYKCSICGEYACEGNYGNNDNLTDYCPNCGAKMDGRSDA